MSDGGCVADPAASLRCSTGGGHVNDMSESGPGWAFLKVAEEPAASLRFASGISECVWKNRARLTKFLQKIVFFLIGYNLLLYTIT